MSATRKDGFDVACGLVGSLGFEPRIANAPGWYPKPWSPSVTRDTHHFTDSRRRPPNPQYTGNIIKTLLKAEQEGKASNTIRAIDKSLSQISHKTDLNNSEQVKTYIANATNQTTGRPLTNSSKSKLSYAYEWYCTTNGIEYKNPTSKYRKAHR